MTIATLPTARDHYTQHSPQGRLIKVEAVYGRPFWREDGLTGAVVSDTGPAKICYDVTPADGSVGGLLGFVGGDEARRWGDDHAALEAAVLEQFVEFFGPEAARPTEVVVQDRSDEIWSRGGPVHLLGPGALTQDREAIWAPVGRLHRAGTETATFWHGYMCHHVRPAGRGRGARVGPVNRRAGDENRTRTVSLGS